MTRFLGLNTLIVVMIAVGVPVMAASSEDRDDDRNEASVCALPPDPGPCDDVILRWYFNVDTGICEPFGYGGCEGNENNFETLVACQFACMDFCALPPKYGPCQANHHRWYFNPHSGGCEQFIYGGCEPNANNFLSLAECEASCGGEVPACHLPLQQGECEGDPGWHYEPPSLMCKQVSDGWCGTDVNRYATEQACLDACFIPPCWGDLNGDGIIDGADLLILLSDWGSYCPSWHPCASDLTTDGTVDGQDLLFLLAHWGPCPWPW